MATTEERIGTLKKELEATADRGRQAVIQYEIGHLTQRELANEAQAVREYLGAYNLDPKFRPPLLELVSIFERRRSSKNLLRLYDAQARSATTPREGASSLADRAILLTDHLGEGDDARGLLETAFQQAAEASDIALLLEHELFARGETDAAMAIVEARADLVRDPVLATLLRIELARAHEKSGDIDAAIDALRVALGAPVVRWRVLDELERIARAAGRPKELAAALEGQAKLAAAAARGEDKGQASGAFSLTRFPDQERASARASALFREAGRIRASALGDAERARRCYDDALALRPSDPLLRYERMLACELAGDLDGAAEEATNLLEAGAGGAMAAALQFRLAERAMLHGESEVAKRALEAGLEADPESAVLTAMLDDLTREMGDLPSAFARLMKRADSLEGAAKAESLFEAADLAAYRMADAPAARAAYTAAAEASEEPSTILREAFSSALRLGDAAGARQFAEALLAQEIDGEERSALLRDTLELVRLVLEDGEAAQAVLDQALAAPDANEWAPDLARLTAALAGDATRLAAAHQALADRAADDETAAAHLCAKARAQVRAGDDDAAVESLRTALQRSPFHPYASALLEEVFRARGDAEEVVKLLREAADKEGGHAAEQRLLLAGAAAEAADDVERAIQMYEEAAEKDLTSLAPVLALQRLATGQADDELLLRSLEAASQREITAGEPGRHTLALGLHYDLISGKPELAEDPLRLALASEDVALAAAVDLALLPIAAGDATRIAGLELMLRASGDEAKPGILREAAAAALAVRDTAKAGALLDELGSVAPNDRWAAIARLRLAGLDETRRGDRAKAWLSLGRATDDHDVAAELVNHGLRAQVLGEGADAVDEAVIVAHEILSVAPESLHASIALDEALNAGDDPEGRAEALGSWLAHAGPAGRVGLSLAHGRALATAGRPREALEVLLRVAATDDDDLASWETIRGCARDVEAWAPLVEACDRLAHIVPDDELKMLLWEESAAVLMDELDEGRRAERRLRRILAIDATRPIAYGRLHDLLADRGDDDGLLALVNNRIELVDEPEELVGLFYEQARLHRILGLSDDALGALDNLLMLESGHVGGLALLVELQVQRENWPGAVEALQALAGGDDVPASQRRIARLGAADFLDNKLNDAPGALAELNALHEGGLADIEIYERTATLAERLDEHDLAVEALGHAVEHAPSAGVVAQLERRAGAVHSEKRLDRGAAIDAYRRALAASATDVHAGQALADLLDDEETLQHSERFEQSVRNALAHTPTDGKLLRTLARAGLWRGDAGLQEAVLGILVGIGIASEDERKSWELGSHLLLPRGALDDAALAMLRTPGVQAPPMRLAMAISSSAAEMDGLEPSGFGLGRGDVVKEDSPLKAELRAFTQMFGLPAPELFTGGSLPTRLDIAPDHKGKPTWITGSDVRAPLSYDQRFTVGWLTLGVRLGVTPFVRRGPTGAALALFAAAEAADVPLGAGGNREGMAETKKRIYKTMPRRVRKSLPDIVRTFQDDGQGIDAWTQELARTAQRGGMLAANDPGTALRRVLGAAPSPELVERSPDALDIFFFWLSPACIALRQKLGLSA